MRSYQVAPRVSTARAPSPRAATHTKHKHDKTDTDRSYTERHQGNLLWTPDYIHTKRTASPRSAGKQASSLCSSEPRIQSNALGTTRLEGGCAQGSRPLC